MSSKRLATRCNVFGERTCERVDDKVDTTPNNHMVWWRKDWWIRVEDGQDLRTAKKRCCAVRAATRGAEEAALSKARVTVSDVESRLTKEDLPRVRGLAKKEISDESATRKHPNEDGRDLRSDPNRRRDEQHTKKDLDCKGKTLMSKLPCIR